MEDRLVPTRAEILEMVSRKIYGTNILNNSHRGDVVEMMVLAALEPEFSHVGLGWHPWDLQRGKGADRVRIQVRQTAAVQMWGKTVTRKLQFGWKPNAPSYFQRDNPDEPIESDGWFCDLFVFGIHDKTGSDADHADPAQWEFMVIPVCDLKPRTASMSLSIANERWERVIWSELRIEVNRQNERLRQSPQLDRNRGPR